MDRPKDRCVIALMGPTASGKSEMAIQLADRFNLALISVDSAMVYRGLDIGTDKPSPEVLAKHPHALVDVVDPETDFSAREFVDAADTAVRHAFESERVPLLVGGTMLYFKLFREGISRLPGRNPQLREQLRSRAQSNGVNALYRELQSIDPEAAKKIHPNNYSRIERALEVYQLTGTPLSKLQVELAGQPVEDRLTCDYREFALMNTDRSELHARIDARVHRMLDSGFVSEVRKLRQRPNLTASAMSMRSVGYRQVWEFLERCPTLSIDQTTVDAIAAATRGLARRQLTWLRSWRENPEHTQLDGMSPLEQIVGFVQELGAVRKD